MTVELTITFKGQPTVISVSSDITLGMLQEMIEEKSSVPLDNQKLFAPKVGMVKANLLPHKLDTLVTDVFPTPQARKKIMLMGTPIQQLRELQETEIEKAQEAAKFKQRARRARWLGSSKIPSKSSSGSRVATLDSLRASEQVASSSSSTANPTSPFTFQKLIPLPFLPNPEKSLQFMERLRDDRGIQAIMKKYKWTVPVMTELDPASNTTHQSRLLGLNRNKGQVIELRLRTDAYDGWCNYKEVRNVLCHELSHNVHQNHDADFWALTRKLEKEVVMLDPFGSKGKAVTNQEFYDGPGLRAQGEEEETGETYDEGGWFGSVRRLGTLSESGGNVDGAGVGSGSTSSGGKDAEEMRAILRRAAEDRQKRGK